MFDRGHNRVYTIVEVVPASEIKVGDVLACRVVDPKTGEHICDPCTVGYNLIDRIRALGEEIGLEIHVK